MLLSHLYESEDELPLLARLINQRIQRGDRVFVHATLVRGNSTCFGRIFDVRLSTGIASHNGLDGLPMVVVEWDSKSGPFGRSETIVQNSTFDEKFTLTKDEDGDWVLENA
jgi:hypothetical protein